MKRTFIVSILALTTLAKSCDKKPIESEQYKKMVYLVGAQNTTQQLTVDYSEAPIETFVSVASSGSLNIEKDVRVSLSNPVQIIHDYNTKFFEEDQIDLFLKPLSTIKYEFLNKDNLVIKASDGVYARQPITIATADLHPDSIYAIPVAIEEVSDYEINTSLDQLIVTLKLQNKYSGNYGMVGQRKNLTSNATSVLQKNKVLTATAVNKIRMYIGDNSENLSTRESETVLLDIQADNTIKITAWGSLTVLSGSGTYSPSDKTFDLEYTYQINGVSYKVSEKLIFI